MTIKFLSKINQNGEESVIDFDAQMQESTQDEFRVFEFKDPKSEVMNRIEVSETMVNIFSGPATINLELNQTIQIVFETNPGALLLEAHLFSLTQSKEEVHFKYTLAHNGQQIGSYDITLTISE